VQAIGVGTYSRSLNLAPGVHQLTVVEDDGFGDTSTSATFTLTIDPNDLSKDQVFVRYLYSTILGRPGSLPEWNLLIPIMNNPALPSPMNGRLIVANAIEHSQEARIRLVQGWYLTYLNRPADNAGLNALVGLLLQGFTEESVLTFIFGSQEYFLKAPARLGFASSPPSDAIFVQALYKDLLSHNPGVSEVNTWVSFIPSMGRPGVASLFLRSAEHRIRVIKGYYIDLLQQPNVANDGFSANAWNQTGLDLGTIRAYFEAAPQFYFIPPGFRPPR